MNARWKLPVSLFVVPLLFISSFSAASAQFGEEVGTVDLRVVACDSVANHGIINTIPADCVNAGGSFTFYMRGDGTADYTQLLVLETDGLGNINLNPGDYEVVEENTQTHFDLTVTADETTQATFAFASGIIPEPDTVRLYITSLVCVNYEAASFISFDGNVPAECTRVGNDVFTLYMYGDGTDDYVQVVSSGSGPAYIDLLPGRYLIVHEATQMSSDLMLDAGSDYSMAFTLPAPVDNGPPETPVATTPTPAPTSAPVKSLPNTGAGDGNDVGIMLAAAAVGALLLTGATMRIRQND